MKTKIGVALIIIAFLIFLIAWNNPREIQNIMPLYAICLISGIGLCAGDYIKWRGKKFQQGINEANKNLNVSKYCTKCGNSINEDSIFCSHCGSKIN